MEKYENTKLYKIRHSTAHLLAYAVQQLYPNVKIAIGPVIEEGFYYDFDFGKESISEEDLEKIENKMKELHKQEFEFEQQWLDINKAKEKFKDEPYKLEIIKEIEKGEREDLGQENKVCVYKSGKFEDLCKGPHIKNIKEVKAFKLLSTAGAYWKGDENNEMLTRIYGTAFESKGDLKKHLEMLEEQKKRDHRTLGQKLDLFHFSEEVGKGLPLWTPKGNILKEELENWAKETEKEWGYERVTSPHIGKENLYLTSGHLPYYEEDMYPSMDLEGEKYYLKGMNCPHHHEIFKRNQVSYKDLPIKYAEYGTVYRNEMSGSLFGLMRVRFIEQNDAHIYCTKEQAVEQFIEVLKLHDYYYQALGLTKDDYYAVIGLPDENKRDKYHGDKKLWDEAEAMMREAIEKHGIRVEEDVGGAAFYGPKVDINIISAIGREFSISTNQLDLYMPQRFNLEYTNEEGEKETPVIIHRAPLGSHERFIGFLIEHFAGAFPVWLSPVQVEIIPINDDVLNYAEEIKEKLEKKDVRVKIDKSSETMQNKIRKAQEQKTPYMLIVGPKEEKENKISIRTREEEQHNFIDFDKFDKVLSGIIKSKSLNLWESSEK